MLLAARHHAVPTILELRSLLQSATRSLTTFELLD
jgi:hypothetical protein